MSPASMPASRAYLVEVEVRVPDVPGDILNVHTVVEATPSASFLRAATTLPPAVSASAVLVGFVSVDEDDMLTDGRLYERDIFRAMVNLASHSRDSW
jgi:hypothetical protein